MKKTVILVVSMIIAIAVSTTAMASDLSGLYLSSKFVYAPTTLDNVREYEAGTGYYERIGTKHDDAFGGVLAIGYDFSKKFNIPIRGELEYGAYSGVEASNTWFGYTAKQSFDFQTFFINAYYDYDTGTAFTPYVGAGIGLAIIDTDYDWKFNNCMLTPGSVSSRQRTNLAYNLGLGASYAFTENISLDGGYRFAALGPVKSKTDTDLGFYAKTKNVFMHQFYIGLRFTM